MTSPTRPQVFTTDAEAIDRFNSLNIAVEQQYLTQLLAADGANQAVTRVPDLVRAQVAPALVPLNSAIAGALAAQVTDRKFISGTTSMPVSPSPTDLTAFPGDIIGSHLNTGGATQPTLWNRTLGTWQDNGQPGATLTQFVQAITPTVTIPTRAALSTWDRQGGLYAFAEGKRWAWEGSGTSNGKTVVDAAGGGIWRMEGIAADTPDTLTLSIPGNALDVASVATHQWTATPTPRTVNLSAAHTNSQPTSVYRASYPVTGTGFTQDMVGMALTAGGATAFVIRVNSGTQLWVDRPMGTSGSPLGSSVTGTFSPRRWGQRVVPGQANPSQPVPGAWVQQTPDETVYAAGFGFAPGNSRASNTAALQLALDYAVTFGKYRVVLPNGISQCNPVGSLSTNIRLEGSGQTIIDVTDNTDYLFNVTDSLSTTNDQLGQQFTQNNQAGIFNVIIRGYKQTSNITTPSGYGVKVGNEAGVYGTAGSGYRMHIGLQGLKRGLRYVANNWTIRVSGWAYECETVIEHFGGINTGENLIFDQFHLSESFGFAVSCLGTGAKLTFNECSVDNNFSALNIASGAGGYDVVYNNCWFEYRTGEEYLQAASGHGSYCSLRINGGTVIRNTDPGLAQVPGSANPGSLIGLGFYNIPAVVTDVVSWSYAERTGYLNGPRQVTVSAGSTSITVTGMLWSSVLAPPRVELLNAPGVAWSLDLGSSTTPDATTHHQMTIRLAAPAPTGGVIFSVWA